MHTNSQIVPRASVSILLTSDLSQVRAFVERQHPEWSGERLDAAETAYRHYLITTHVGERAHPNEDADIMWHAHILHTKDYARFCEEHFGKFLHHTPTGKTCGYWD
ncbi:hypothetical protein KTR10_02430 [Candidatus Kaiserbacteria bacterium]|nr:hypothetical protein [Candidatus Kaiserbacteria bacterium]